MTRLSFQNEITVLARTEETPSHLDRRLGELRAGKRAWGRPWIVPSSSARSQRQALTDLAAAVGARPARVSRIPWPVLTAAGVLVPPLPPGDRVGRDLPQHRGRCSGCLGPSWLPWRTWVWSLRGFWSPSPSRVRCGARPGRCG